jgi:glycosyltransferase involved in cell wall biosynthesis
LIFSVIIPTCNRNDTLSKCLDCLKPAIQLISINEYEIIVTDDSKNHTAKQLIDEQHPWVCWAEGPKKGPASNRNNGARLARGEWLLFIDDDCVPDSNILYEYNKAINAYPENLAFEGRIFVDKPQSSFLQECPINEEGGVFWSCNICLKKSFFDLLTGFDENFPIAAMEDIDLFKRIKQKTDKYAFVYNAAVFHPWRITPHLFATTLKRNKSLRYFVSKYPDEAIEKNHKYYFLTFLVLNKQLLINSWRFKFSGFGKKFLCNFLLLYFGFKVLLRVDK